MMQKQISKKKLERLTVIGGDYRRAGERATGSHLTLAKLRQLLEDDVKNLARMGAGAGAGAGATANAATVSAVPGTATEEGAASASDSGSRGRGICMDIHETELNAIMDRKQLFPLRTPVDGRSSAGVGIGSTNAATGSSSSSSTHQSLYGPCTLAQEGTMYDLLDQQQTTGVLSAVK
jgi:hypothetical protein